MKSFNWPVLGLIAFVILFVCVSLWPRTSPTIVVNMPADAKSLSELTKPGDKVIGSDRATLWWTVYHASISGNSSLMRDNAARYADQAVLTVYGPPK